MIAPTSFAQKRLWFLDQLYPDNPAFNIPAAIEIKGPLNMAAIALSLRELVDRHEALRTRFSDINGEAVQVIHPSLDLAIPIVDLREVPEIEQAAYTRDLIISEGRCPFDLTSGPLLRVALAQLGEIEHIMFLTIHHIISDGWSMSVIIKELGIVYEAFLSGDLSPLPRLAIQYVDYAYWEKEWLKSDYAQSQLDYWRERLGQHPSLIRLPMDYPRPAVQSYRGAREYLAIPQALTERLRLLGSEEGASLFICLMAALQTLLYRYSGERDIQVGATIAGRNAEGTESVVGFFLNTLIIRGDLSGKPTFRQFLRRLRDVALAAYENQDVPIDLLFEAFKLDRTLSRNPMFQILFVFQNTPPPVLEFANLKLRPIDIHNGTSKFDMTLDLSEADGGIRGWIEYDTSLFKHDTIIALAGHYHRLLEAAVGDPEQDISSLPILSYQEEGRIFGDLGRTGKRYPDWGCVHDLFQKQVEKTPDKVAAVFKTTFLTYQQIDEQSTMLANVIEKLSHD